MKSLLSAMVLAALSLSCSSSGAETLTTDKVKLIPVPLCRQATDYSCGAAALQSVLGFYGEDIREGEVSKACGTNHSEGTNFTRMAKYAQKKGYKVQHKVNMTLEDLRKLVAQGQPVICLIQAWAERKVDYAKDWNDGHYVVAIGMDDKNVYFMDPSTLGNYTYIPIAEFLDRWHDTERVRKLPHFGMTIAKSRSTYVSNEIKKML